MLIESWASLKSFRPKDDPPSSSPKGRNEEVDFRKTRYIGTEKVAWHFSLTAAAYNLVRMRNLGHHEENRGLSSLFFNDLLAARYDRDD